MEPARPLTPNLFPAAAKLLTDAFFSNPAHVYICPDPELRQTQLEWLLAANLWAQPDLSSSFCVVESGSVIAMGFWNPPHSQRAGGVRKLRAGLLRGPSVLGLGGFRRLMEVSGAIDQHCEKALEARPCWYLNNMAVREDLRGKGMGSSLLRQQLLAIRERHPTDTLALATQRTENVAFYGHLGFEVLSEAMVGRGEASFKNWIMRCGPAADHAAARLSNSNSSYQDREGV